MYLKVSEHFLKVFSLVVPTSLRVEQPNISTGGGNQDIQKFHKCPMIGDWSQTIRKSFFGILCNH